MENTEVIVTNDDLPALRPTPSGLTIQQKSLWVGPTLAGSQLTTVGGDERRRLAERPQVLKTVV